MPLSFRVRLTLWYSVVLAVLLIVASFVLIITLRRMAVRELDATLWVLGTTEAEGIANQMHDRGLRRPDGLAINEIDYRGLPGYEDFHVEKYVTIVNSDREVADFSQNLGGRPLPINDQLLTQTLTGAIKYDTADAPNEGRLRVVYIPSANRKTEPFVVIVGIPADFVGASTLAMARRLVPIMITVLILAMVSGLVLARSALRPIAQTAASVKSISDANLNERLAEPGTRDEFDQLIKGFNDLLGRLDAAFDLQRKFTSDASHELGTPLTVLKGNTEVALLQRHSPEEYEVILRSNLEEIERLSSLVSNLLLLARSDAAEPFTTSEVVSLNQQASKVISRLAPLAEQRGVDLRADLSIPVLIQGDPIALQQIIANLLSNALRYTATGGHVQLTISRSQGIAIIEIEDDGVGIPHKDIPRIFDRFFRAENARAHDFTGSGLGLAICQTLAKAHGGRIEVESQVGRGSRFTLVLPAIEIESIVKSA